MTGYNIGALRGPIIPVDAFQHEGPNTNAPEIPDLPQKGLHIAEAVGEHSSPISKRLVTQQRSLSFNDLNRFDSDQSISIRQAKTADEARKSIPVLQRAFDWIYACFAKNYTTRSDAAAAFFDAINGKKPEEACLAVRALLKPEERHHVKLQCTESRGELRVTNEIGPFKLGSELVQPGSPRRSEVDEVIRAMKLSDQLAQQAPPIDIESALLQASPQLRMAQITGDLEDFMTVHSQLEQAHPGLCQIETMNDDQGKFIYSLNIGGEEVFKSPPLLNDALTSEEKAHLAQLDQLTPDQIKALSHKLDNARLSAQLAQELYPLVNKEVEAHKDNLTEAGYTSQYATAESYEQALMSALDGKTDALEKYKALNNFIISTSNPEHQTNEFPISAKRDPLTNLYSIIISNGEQKANITLRNHKEEAINSANYTYAKLQVLEEVHKTRFSHNLKMHNDAELSRDLPRANFSVSQNLIKGFLADSNTDPAFKNIKKGEYNLDLLRSQVIKELNCTPEQQSVLETLAYQKLQGIVMESGLFSHGGKVEFDDFSQMTMLGLKASVSYDFESVGDNIKLRAQTIWDATNHNISDLKTIKEPVISIELTVAKNGDFTIDHINAFAADH